MQTDTLTKMTTLDALVTPSPRRTEPRWRLEPIEIREDTPDTSEEHVYSHVSVHPSGDFVTFRRRSIFPTVLTTELLGYDPSTREIRKLLREEMKMPSHPRRFPKESRLDSVITEFYRYGDFFDYVWISDSLLVAASIVFPDDLEHWRSFASCSTSSNLVPEIPRRVQLTAYDFKIGGRKRYDLSRIIVEQSRGEWEEYNGVRKSDKKTLGINTFNAFDYDPSQDILKIYFDSSGCEHSQYNSVSLQFTPKGEIRTVSYYIGEILEFGESDKSRREEISARNKISSIKLREERDNSTDTYHLEGSTDMSCPAFKLARLSYGRGILSVTDYIETPEGFPRDNMPCVSERGNRHRLLPLETDIFSISEKATVLCLYGKPYLLKTIEGVR